MNQNTYPFSLPQQDIYYEQLLVNSPHLFNIGAKVVIEGELNEDYLRRALHILVREHEILRLRIIQDEDAPKLEVIPDMEYILDTISFETAGDPLKSANEFIRKDFQIGFDLSGRGPLYKFVLLKLSSSHYFLYAKYHHIIVDGWGTSLLYKRWTELYNSFSANASADADYSKFRYSKFCEEDTLYTQSEKFNIDSAYWKSVFAIFSDPIFSPELRYMQEKDGQDRYNDAITVERRIYNNLKNIAEENKCSVFQLLIAVLFKYFRSICSADEMVFGLPTLNRTDFLSKQTVGLFTTITPLRIADPADISLLELMGSIKDGLKKSYRYQKYPLRQIMIDSKALQSGIDQLYDIFFSYEKHDYEYKFSGCKCQVIPVTSINNRSAISIYVREFDSTNDVIMDISINLKVVSRQVAEKIPLHISTILQNLEINGAIAGSSVKFLSDSEKDFLLTISGSGHDLQSPGTNFISQFEGHVKTVAEKTAASFGNSEITYGSLNKFSNQIGRFLMEHVATDGNDVVGIMLHRSEWLLPVIIGILKSNSAYLPIDLSYPQERVSAIFSNSKIKLCIIESDHDKYASAYPGIRFILLQNLVDLLHKYDNHNIGIYPAPGNLAYLIYTSGTTGIPKGVEITHNALTNFLVSMRRCPGIDATDKILAITSYTFDISILELLGPLFSGASVILANDNEIKDLKLLIDRFGAEAPTWMQATPAMWSILLESGWRGHRNLKLLTGGEDLPEHLAEQLLNFCSSLWNMYGPTETTIWSTTGRIESSANIHVGKPIDNTRTYILGKRKELLPLYVTGELYIGGAGIAKGYRNASELTREKFIPDPFRNNEYLYQTGDLCQWQYDGNIKYLGRADNQVKIRGHRIECLEIENLLLQLGYVKQAVVCAVENKESEKSLAAFIIPQHNIQKPDFFDYLRKYLPLYMIPGHFIEIEQIPLTVSGKINKAQLKNLYSENLLKRDLTTDDKSPDENLSMVLTIWREVLELPFLNINDNFFVCGGDSIKAIRIISKIQTRWDIRLEMGQLFAHPTAYELSQLIKDIQPSLKPVIGPSPEAEYYALSASQKKIWLLSQGQFGSHAYKMQAAIRVNGQLNTDHLKRSFELLIRSNSILRTKFVVKDSVPVQQVADMTEVNGYFEKIDIKDDSEINTICERYSTSKFDLSRPLLRIAVLKKNEKEFIIFISAHHLLADARSFNVIIRDVIEFYKLFQKGFIPTPRRKKLEYKDFCLWENNLIASPEIQEQKTFWLKEFENTVPQFRFPYKRIKRTTLQASSGSTVIGNISVSRSMQLYALSGKFNITVNSFLIGLYTLVLHKYCNQSTIVTGIAMADDLGRDGEDMIGLLTNFVPLVTYIEPEKYLLDHIINISKKVAVLNEYKKYPLEDIFDNIRFEDPKKKVLYSTALIYHSEKSYSYLKKKSKELHFNIKPFPLKTSSSTLDFKLDVFETFAGGPLNCVLEYDDQLLSKEAADGLMNTFLDSLNFLDRLDSKISELDVERPGSLIAEKTAPASGQDQAEINIQIISSFTSNEITDHIDKYASLLSLPIRSSHAPYNQLFQELGKESEDERTEDDIYIKLLFIRFEDSIMYHNGTVEQKQVLLKHTLNSIKQVLKRRRDKDKFVVGIFPTGSVSDDVRPLIEKTYREWISFIGLTMKIQLIDFREVEYFYKCNKVFDHYRDRIAHIPYTEQFFAGAAAMIIRKLNHFILKPLKAIVVDCDNTLWTGVCGETEPGALQISPVNKLLQQFLIAKHNEGFLLGIVSKNNEDDVWNVFYKNPGMIIQREMFSVSRINWESKSKNLRQICQELNIKEESILFLDDNIAECVEVLTHEPDIFTLQVPQDYHELELLLYHLWGLNKWTITREDKDRNTLYKEERKRKDASINSKSLDDFFRQLKLKIGINPIAEEDADRISQLTYRTTQFNLSGKKRTIEQVLDKMNTVGLCWKIEAADAFGAYGIIGVMIGEIKNNDLYIDTFLLSCRALGRRIEEAVLYALSLFCRQKGISQINFPYTPTKNNIVIRNFLEKECLLRNSNENEPIYIVSPDKISKPAAIELKYLQALQVYKRKESTEVPDAGYYYNKEKTVYVNSKKYSVPEYLFSRIAASNIHLKRYMVLSYLETEKLLSLHDIKATVDISDPSLRSVPEFQFISREYAKAVSGNVTDLHGNFFEQGGNSLKVPHMLSQLFKKFSVDISIEDFFRQPTLFGLYQQVITRKNIEGNGHAIAHAPTDILDLTSDQKRIWLQGRLSHGVSGYTNFLKLYLNGQYDFERINSVFVNLIKRHGHLSVALINEGNDFPRLKKLIWERSDLDRISFLKSRMKARQNEAEERILKFIRKNFVATERMIRAVLFEITRDTSVLVFAAHPMIIDGFSLQELGRQFINDYRNLTELGKIPEADTMIQFQEFIDWEKNLKGSESYRVSRNYWMNSFSNSSIAPYHKRSRKSREFNRIRLFEKKLADISFYNIARHSPVKEIKSSIVILSLLECFLNYTSWAEEITLGVLVDGDLMPDADSIIGVKEKILPVRSGISDEYCFIQICEHIDHVMNEALVHRFYSYPDLVDDFARLKDMAIPRFDMLVVHKDDPGSPEIAAGLTAKMECSSVNERSYDTCFEIRSGSSAAALSIVYDKSVFNAGQMEEYKVEFNGMMEWLLANPGEPLKNYKDYVAEVTKGEKNVFADFEFNF